MIELPLFKSLLEEQGGLYVAVKPDQESIEKIFEWCESSGISMMDSSELHCTLAHSETYDDVEINNDSTYKATPLKLDLFGEDENTLVLVLDSDDLSDRHNFLHDNYNLKYDFETYIPHISITYNSNLSREDLDSLPSVDSIGELVLQGEYSEPLDK